MKQILDSTTTFFILLENSPKQIDQDEIIEIIVVMKVRSKSICLILLITSVLAKLSQQNHLIQQAITELVLSLIVNHEEHLLLAIADTTAKNSNIFRYLPQPHSSKMMKVIWPPGLQWVINLLKRKLGCNCDLFIPNF
jgi:Na+/pantothenate symporter